jgi:hypothetical protein
LFIAFALFVAFAALFGAALAAGRGFGTAAFTSAVEVLSSCDREHAPAAKSRAAPSTE